MHFRILKMIASSGFLTALECTKFNFGHGSAPDPAPAGEGRERDGREKDGKGGDGTDGER